MEWLLWFLAGIGVLALLLLLALVIAGFWLKAKLKRFGDELAKLAGGMDVPPFRITLVPRDDLEWDSPETLAAITDALKANGYELSGNYGVEQLEDIPLRGFANVESRTYAVVYAHPGAASPVADFVCTLEDGTHLTVSNAPETGLARPPFAPLVRLELDLEADPKAIVGMHQRLLQERGERSARTVTTEAFWQVFETAYAEEMDWRIRRGGLTAEEVEAAARVDGREELDDEAVEMLQNLWRSAIDEFLAEYVRQSFETPAGMTGTEWERKQDHIVVVHQHNDLATLLDKLTEARVPNVREPVEEDDDDEVFEAEMEAHEEAIDRANERFAAILDDAADFRAGFVAAQAELPDERRFEKLGELQSPCSADVYVKAEAVIQDWESGSEK